MEFGHADNWPAEDIAISPYLVNAIETVTGSISVRILDPQRAFWEKATILHEIAHRSHSISFPPRYSRHYYDVVRLAYTPIGRQAIQNLPLLEAVARYPQRALKTAH